MSSILPKFDPTIHFWFTICFQQMQFICIWSEPKRTHCEIYHVKMNFSQHLVPTATYLSSFVVCTYMLLCYPGILTPCSWARNELWFLRRFLSTSLRINVWKCVTHAKAAAAGRLILLNQSSKRFAMTQMVHINTSWLSSSAPHIVKIVT